MRIVGVIPAAGYATRLQPLGCSKEVYPIAGKPVMDFLVERMLAASCSELRIVTRPDKQDVIENAVRHGAAVVEGFPDSLAESVLLGAAGLAGDDIALLGFPDSIWEPVDGFARVLDALGSGREVVLGIFKTTEPTRHEPVIVDDSGRVLRLEFKPERASSAWVWGIAAAPVHVLRRLEGEREPGILFDRLSADGRVGAVRLPSMFLDIGTPAGLREAQAAMAAGGAAI